MRIIQDNNGLWTESEYYFLKEYQECFNLPDFQNITIQEFIKNKHGDDESTFYKIQNEKFQDVGFMIIRPSVFEGTNEIALLGVYNEYSGKGYGAQALDEYLKLANCEGIIADINMSNPKQDKIRRILVQRNFFQENSRNDTIERYILNMQNPNEKLLWEDTN